MTVARRQTLRNLLFAATILASPLIAVAPTAALAQAAIGLSVEIAPPVLPVYDQPPIPDSGYIWTPGYWAWSSDAGYFWVPGTWVLPPAVGLLWTPPYWGWNDGVYLFHEGYWGPHVGYYGGVNYGFGYGGHGYQGGRWQGGGFVYNRTVNNFGSVHIANAYEQRVTVVNNSHVGYAGGAGGLRSQPTPGERLAEHDQHVPVTGEQTGHIAAAGKSPALAASHNNGRPAIAATSRPAQFEGAGVVAPKPAGAGRPAAAIAAPHPAPAPVHEAPAQERPAPHPVQQAAPHPAQHEPAPEKEREKKPEF